MLHSFLFDSITISSQSSRSRKEGLFIQKRTRQKVGGKAALKGDNVVIGLDCDTPLSVVDMSVRQKISSNANRGC